MVKTSKSSSGALLTKHMPNMICGHIPDTSSFPAKNPPRRKSHYNHLLQKLLNGGEKGDKDLSRL